MPDNALNTYKDPLLIMRTGFYVIRELSIKISKFVQKERIKANKSTFKKSNAIKCYRFRMKNDNGNIA